MHQPDRIQRRRFHTYEPNRTESSRRVTLLSTGHRLAFPSTSPCPQNTPNTRNTISDSRNGEGGNSLDLEEKPSIPAIARVASTIVIAIAFQMLDANGAKYVFHLTAVESGLLMYTRHLQVNGLEEGISTRRVARRVEWKSK